MNPQKSRRERSCNYTPDEVRSLVEVCIKHKDIIESKKLDSATWKLKDEAWHEITEEYNLLNVGSRSSKTLKIKYESLKKTIRKKLIENKTQAFLPDGGVHSFKDYEELLVEKMGFRVESFRDADSGSFETGTPVPLAFYNSENENPDTRNNILEWEMLSECSEMKLEPVTSLEELPSSEETVFETTQPTLNNREEGESPNATDRSETDQETHGSPSPSDRPEPRAKRRRVPTPGAGKTVLLKRKLRYMAREDARKAELFRKTVEYMRKEDARQEERHALQLRLLKRQLTISLIS